MNAKTFAFLILLALATAPAHAQESVRDLTGPGQFGAFLTPGQIDRWVFDGDKGETIIAHVLSKEFDPLLGLAKTAAKKDANDDTVLADIDDPGAESRFMFRLPEKGQYKIRVQAFKSQGGGNYLLRVQRFQPQPLTVGKPLLGTFDREGRSYHFFQGVKDEILIPDLKGASAGAWKMLDVKGRDLRDWAGSVLIDEPGESVLMVTGQPDHRYDLVVRTARRLDAAPGKDQASKLGQGELDVLSFQGQPGDFRLVEVEKKGDLHARLIFAPLDKKAEQKLSRMSERPELQFLPVASRGGHLRYAALLGRAGRYQLQLLAAAPSTYKLAMKDPSIPLDWGKDSAGNLPVGGAGFYTFKAAPGQLFHANLASQKFFPVLRLYNKFGAVVAGSGDDADDLEAALKHMVIDEGQYRLHVSSLGDGGGGDFRLALKDIKLKDIVINGRGQGTLQPGGTDFWTFQGEEGKTVFLNVRSADFDPAVSLRSPDGVHLAADNKGNPATGALLPLRLPKTGRYTIAITSRRGAGDYTLRLIDGD